MSVNVLVSKEMVNNAPNKKADEPISKQDEIDLAGYYKIPNYWSQVGPWGGYSSPAALALADKQQVNQNNAETDQKESHYLRSVNEMKGELTGFKVEGIGGKIGHVADVIIDEVNWKISYLVVETSKFFTANFILVATDWINDIQSHDKKIYVEVDSEKVTNVTDFDIHAPITKEYEKKLYAGLGKENE